MKNDKEFLEAIYKKAEVLEREKYKKNKLYKNFIRYSSVAAIIIILPLLIFNNQLLEPNTDSETPIQPRTMSVIDPLSNFDEAEYILIGTTENIDRNDITISVDEVLYGDLTEDEILIDTLEVVTMEGFKKGDRDLIFLNKDDKYYLTFGMYSIFKEIERDVYKDSFGNNYDLKDIKNNIDRRQYDEKDS